MTNAIAEPTFTELIERTNTQKPKDEDTKALRKMLREKPELWRRVGDQTLQAIGVIFEGAKMVPAIRESILAGMRELKKNLGYDASPVLEQLLIDNLLMLKIQADVVAYKYGSVVTDGGYTLNQALHWEKCHSMAQARYLRAVEALAKVRKMALPVIQVNIASEGGQQVNVGTLVKT